MEQNQSSKEEESRLQRQDAAFKSNMVWIISIVAAAIFLIGFFWLSMSDSKEAAAVPSELLVIAADDHIVGLADAPVTIIEYLDFECEACGAYYPLMKELEETYPEDLRIVNRYFPLPSHKNSMTAALAVEAASRQGKYQEMFDLTFQKQKEWGEKPKATPEVFEGYAEKIGLDMAKFRADVASPSVKERVERDVEAGQKLGNDGTPTFFLNGKKINNPNGLEAYKKLIDDAILEAQTSSGQ